MSFFIAMRLQQIWTYHFISQNQGLQIAASSQNVVYKLTVNCKALIPQNFTKQKRLERFLRIQILLTSSQRSRIITTLLASRKKIFNLYRNIGCHLLRKDNLPTYKAFKGSILYHLYLAWHIRRLDKCAYHAYFKYYTNCLVHI
jgi:hypothetical protein